MSSYTKEDKKEILNSVIAEMVTGRSVLSILNDVGMPSRDTLYRWIAADEDVSDKYTRALSIRADVLVDQIIDISDSTDEDEIKLDSGKVVTNHRVIQRDRLRVDSRKWIAARMNPKKYGDKIEIENTGGEKKPPVFNFKDLNDE